MSSDLLTKLVKPAKKSARKRRAAPSGDQSQRERMAAKRRAERDIPELPAVVNPERKAECEFDLEKFTQYFTEPPDLEKHPDKRPLLFLKLSDLHITFLKDLQDAILYGGLQALAAPRGHGKDTLVAIAALWAIAYGHTRFFLVACWELDAASDRINIIKEQVEINKHLLEDFPEICIPVRALNRAPQRAKQQTYNSEFTRLEWGQHLVFPTIPGSKASGRVVAPGSIQSSMRGMNINGERVTFACISDPATDQSAKSPMQQEDTLRRIQKDIGGMGGHGDPMACVALVTIIRKGDVADRLTDINEFPQWNGRRYKAIEKWPERMDLWEQYEDLLTEGVKEGDKTGRKANAFYLKNRADMDRGSKVAWEDGYVRTLAKDSTRLENSALQHLFNLRWKWGEDAFLTEYQNEPPEEDGAVDRLTREDIMRRVNGTPNKVVPDGYTHLVRFIDVGARELHFATLALTDGATASSFIDYGIVETHVVEGGDKRKIKDVGRPALEKAMLNALRFIRDEELEGIYCNTQGEIVHVELTDIDSGWMPDVVYRFIRESGPKFRATKGLGNSPNQKRFIPQKKKTKLTSKHWYGQIQKQHRVTLYFLDADHWKTHLHERLRQDTATPGACTLYGSSHKVHRRFAAHLVAEEFDFDKKRWEKVSNYNHYLDCAAGCFAAADMIGVRLFDEAKRAEPRPQESTQQKQSWLGNRRRGGKWVG